MRAITKHQPLGRSQQHYRSLRRLGAFTLLGLGLILTCWPWADYFSVRVSLTQGLAEPSWQHPLGTDQLGRDFLARLHLALRETVVPLWGIVLASHGLGLFLAAALVGASYYGGWFCRRLAGVVHGLTVVAVGLPVGILVFFAVVGLEEAGGTALYATLASLLTLKLILQLVVAYETDHQLAYWLSHEALGGSFLKRFFVYGVGRQWRASLLLTLALHLQAALAVETSLSYLGFGVQEPRASLGNMLAAHFDLFLQGHDGLFLTVVGVLLGLAWLPACVRELLPGGAARGRARSLELIKPKLT